ncbi:threonine--tRNA ligase [Candidatus Woesearchaeota archaeon]|nr:threonine--tRNA ligase [Candidatus Woesearchaeota archaeon]MBW2994338.1 threonine--tRNA ligase [Candidatus Woesearchaeota archaeon]
MTNKKESKPNLETIWHSAAHILAHAIKELYPDAKNTIGPAVEGGFYYDFENLSITPEDFKTIERKMKEISKKNYPFEKKEVTLAEIKKMFKNNKYKIELAEDFKKAGDKLTIYKSGDFADLCRGPHVESTGKIKAFKLTKIAGAYWKGDQKNQQLTRVYGIAFLTKDELKDYVHKMEQAAKRDHRKIGRDLDLFSFHDCAPGMPFWHPKGTIVWNELIKYWRKEHDKAGYGEIKTPIILNKALWEQSGHWKHFKENMYFTKVDNQDYALKPMNCPGGIQIYKNTVRSYREFPLRWAELGLVHRHELSGVLAGLFRVRSFTQDDAHIYCVDDKQLKEEIKGVIMLTDKMYKQFGFEYHVELSTKPEKAMGDAKLWDTAEKALAGAMKELKKDYTLNPGDGAFYGPKLDFHLKDALGRTWQCGTLQLDFQLPINFDLKFMGEDGTQNHKPIMLHRTIYGSIERFIGVLIEHVAGKFPLWISPIQVRILTIADRFNDYAHKAAKKMSDAGIRVDIDERSESISKKVREAQLQQINYIIVVGEKEVKDKTITVRTRDNKVHGAEKVDTFIKKVVKEIQERI